MAGSRLLAGVALALGLALAPAIAADGPDDARACVDPARSTADEMAECLGRVRAAADARLNRTYNEALASLPAADAAALREAQRAWLAFREKDWASLSGSWRAARDMAVRIDAAVADVGAINARDAELRVYLPSK